MVKSFSIASFNLYNLNEPGMKMYDQDGWTDEEYEKKIVWISSQARKAAADVIGFQELWHRKSLENVLERSGLADEYDAIVPATANGKKIVCAALVKKGMLIGGPNWIEDFPNGLRLESEGGDPQTPEIKIHLKGFSRPVLHIVVQVDQQTTPIHVFICHFKSKAPTKVFFEEWFKDNPDLYKKHAECIGASLSTIRRTTEAAALRVILNDLMKGNNTPVIVVGDLNDSTYSNTSNILTGQPAYLVGDSLGGSDVDLYSTQTLQEYRDTRDVYYTHVHKDIRESLDQIFVSQEFYDHSKSRLWLFQRLNVDNDHLNDDNHKESGTNDHGIIRASFIYKPFKA